MSKLSLSRRQITDYVAREIILGDKPKAIKELAAYIVESRTTKDLEYYVSDIERSLYLHGETVVDISSARPVSESLVEELRNYLMDYSGASNVYVRQKILPALIGGVVVELPGERLDTTVRHKIDTLRKQKV